MRKVVKSIGCGLAFVVAVLGFNSASATSLTAPPQALGNQGSLFFPVGGNFSLTSRYGMSSAEKFNPNAAGSTGTVWVGSNGTGVQNAAKMNSKSIEGMGSDANEELIINFDVATALDSITIDLAGLNLNGGLLRGDDPFLFIQHASDPSLWEVYNETNWGAAFTSTGPTSGRLNLANLGLASFGVSSVKIRETHELIMVSDVSAAVAVPEPTTWLIMTSCLLLVAVIKRRKDALSRQES